MEKQINNHFIDYIQDWNHYEYFLLGSYGSSKSFNTAIKLILKSIQEKRKILVVRKVFATLKDSCYEDLKEAISFLELDDYFLINKSPLQITCKITGSIFLFRGMDDKAKIKSIKDISLCWIEENEVTIDDYKELKDRMRVLGIKPHIIITTNPTTREHWCYNRFIIEEGITEDDLYQQRIISHNNIYFHHSTYKDNCFLNPDWIRNLEAEKNELLRNIKVYGRFGTVGFKVFTNVSVIDAIDVAGDEYNGLDFGFSVSYNALVEMIVRNKDLYITNEWYSKNNLNSEIIEHIKHCKEKIIADGSEPKTIEEMKRAGVNIEGTGDKEMVKEGIRKLQQFDNIFIFSHCKNAIREFTTLEHPKDDKTGLFDENKYNIDPHTVDAARYGLKKFRHYDYKDRVARKPIGW
jgi:phage terminase large subunit